VRRLPGALLIVALAAAAGRLSADQIVVNKPIAGTYRAGSIMDIVWTPQLTGGIPGAGPDRDMVITLRQYGQQYGGPVPGTTFEEIATADVGALHYAWKVGDYQTNWDGFILTVKMKTRPSIIGQSQPFKIVKSVIVDMPRQPILLNLIRVTSPAAGQNCKIGTTVTIRWETSKIAPYGKVNLQVYWPNHTPAAGPFLTANTGSFDWKINETAENTLCVKVYTQDGKWAGFSGDFNVVK